MSFPQTTQNTQVHLFARNRRYRLGDYTAGPALPYINDWLGRLGLVSFQFIPSLHTIICVTDLINGLIIDNLLPSLLVVNPYVPDNLTACATPVINTNFVGFSPWQSFGGFVVSDLTVNGLAGGGGGKYLNTGFNGQTGWSPQTSNSLIIYTSANTATGFSGGAYDGTNGVMMAANHSDGNYYSYDGQIAINVVSGPHLTPATGYYCTSRTSGTVMNYYHASSTQPHASLGSQLSGMGAGFPVYPLFAHAVNDANTPQFISQDRISFYAIGLGLTSAQSQLLYNRIQAYRQSIGGGFV